MSKVSEEALEATFAFARKLRNPKFRKFLQTNGHEPGQHVVVALPDELASDVFRRTLAQAAPGPALIAIWRKNGEGVGFSFMDVSVEQAAKSETADVAVGSGATIGMLYDTLATDRSQYTIPQSWVHVRRLASA